MPTTPSPGGLRRPPALLALAALLALLGLAAARPAAATTYVVANTNDAGAGSLRAAVTSADADAGSTITFDPAAFTPGTLHVITLTSDLPALSAAVTVTGPGASVAAVDGLEAYQLLIVHSGVTASVSGLTLQNGNAGGVNGGGIANAGTLTVTACTLAGNSALRGGGVSNSSTGTLTLTACTLVGNTVPNLNSQGGGVYNSGGVVTLTRCTLTGNKAPNGIGGGLFNDATMTLTGCILAGNSAVDGGGAFTNSVGTLSLTACTLTANTASTGGAVFANSGGTLTLTDDVLYGDSAPVNGGEIYVGDLTATASDCDIGEAIGPGPEGDGVTDGGGNIDADPQFVQGAAPYDLHLLFSSPAIGQGTADAPGFLPADLDGNPYFTPRAMGAYEGPPDLGTDTHVLWAGPDGRVLFWDVNVQHARLAAGVYGPYADDASGNTGYTATSLATGPDGVSYVLWTNPAGVVYLWAVQRDGSHVDTRYGLFEDDGTSSTIWRAVSVSAGGDGKVHLLWANPNGRTILWDVDAATGGFTIAGNYAPQPGLTASALASGPDGLSHVLWNGPGGQTLLWDLDAQDQPTAHAYGPFSEGTQNTLWSARALSVGPDNVTHLLWNNPDGRTILWDVAAGGSFTIAGGYGPYQDDASGNTGYTAVALATGGDGLSHFAWDDADGDSFLWSVNPDGTHADTFYPPFSDGADVWTAVAVSAAEPGLI